jgi:hypothetical protein
MSFKFEVGEPACPVACKYCHVTELDVDRTANWSQGLVGVNKACTFMNVPPWINEDKATSDRFYNFPWHLLEGDFAGWTAVTDGLMRDLRKYFWLWIEMVSPIAKLTTVVSKWPINADFMEELSRIENFYLVVTITGAEAIEKVSTRLLLRNLERAKFYGVKALPMVHPYISGVSNISFLPELKKLGYDEVCFKGLRYNSETMGSWMPETSKPLYQGHGIDEVLPDDGWQQKVEDTGLSLLSPKQWYYREAINNQPKLSQDEAIANVDQLLQLAQIASSANEDVVRRSLIDRRM